MQLSLSLARGSTVLVLALSLLAIPISPAQADVGDYGYEDGFYSGLQVSHPESATSDKPESKLWHADGSWWASLWIPAASEFHISRLDVETQQWQDTGVAVDQRPGSDADTLWNGTHLFIASHIRATDSLSNSAGQPAFLYRYSIMDGRWSLDDGFPLIINGSSAESMTIDIDSAGYLWATWTQNRKLMLARTAGPADAPTVAWGAPFTPDLPGATLLSRDDISAIVRFARNQTMVMWSNQKDATMYFGVHLDTADPLSWRGGIAIRGPYTADDHMNLKSLDSDQSGRIFAAVKNSMNDSTKALPTDPLVQLLVFKPATGSWSISTFGTLADSHTRPIVMLDETNQLIHMFATGPSPNVSSYDGAGTIYQKTAPMDDPVFAAGRGVPVIRDADSAAMNNVTSSKQSVTSGTGLVVLATNEATMRYWHSYIPLTASEPSPTWSFAPTDDATIRGDVPGGNYGNDTRLAADASPQTHFLLKFNVSTGCAAIKRATLFLTVGRTLYDEADYGGDVLSTDSNWTEGTVTWSTAPAGGATIDSLPAPVAQNAAYSLTVTSAVPGDGTVAFRVSSRSGDGVKYFSKEGTATSAPRLEVAC